MKCIEPNFSKTMTENTDRQQSTVRGGLRIQDWNDYIDKSLFSTAANTL